MKLYTGYDCSRRNTRVKEELKWFLSRDLSSTRYYGVACSDAARYSLNFDLTDWQSTKLKPGRQLIFRNRSHTNNARTAEILLASLIIQPVNLANWMDILSAYLLASECVLGMDRNYHLSCPHSLWEKVLIFLFKTSFIQQAREAALTNSVWKCVRSHSKCWLGNFRSLQHFCLKNVLCSNSTTTDAAISFTSSFYSFYCHMHNKIFLILSS